MKLTQDKVAAIAALAERMLHGNSLLSDYHPKNTDSVLYHAACASRYAKSMILTSGAQILLLQGDEPPVGLAHAIGDVMHTNSGNAFCDMYTPILAGQHQNWIAAFHACNSVIRNSDDQDTKDHLIRVLGSRAFDVLPLAAHLLYEIMDIAQSELKQDLSAMAGTKAHLAIQGILDS